MLQGKQKPPPPSSWDWLQDVELQHALDGQLNSSARARPLPRSRLHIWLLRLSTSILLWTCLIQLLALAQLWQPRFLSGWPPCLDRRDFAANPFPSSPSPSPIPSSLSPSSFSSPALVSPPPRVYKNNGYLLVSCNGGLNQMRAAICDMVAVAMHLNLTLVVPELDKTSFWADPSNFGDIFDIKHFITSLRGEVKIVKNVPGKYHEIVRDGTIMSMAPVSWSNESYYINQILPMIKKHHVLHFTKTDTRLANNGLPVQMQKLRCQVNYEALRFSPRITELGQKLVKILQAKGPFLTLHLRYEMDMLAFSGCNHGCTDTEAEELTKLRYEYIWWKEKVIDSEQKRLDGLCPLTPEETVLVLKALGFDKNTQIYIAAGKIYGGKTRMAPLFAAYPNIVRKEMLLSPEELKPFQNRSSQMAALDYLVSIDSDVFVPTYDGNMAKVVEGHRRFLGYRKSILLDRKNLVELLDQRRNGTLTWEEFSLAVQHVHNDRMGKPRRRTLIPERPKLEDYFYANPEECIA